jgi:hypothetical protein
MKPNLAPIKPWHRMRISRRQYFTDKPWKKAKMSRVKYERIIMPVPQEYLDEIRITAEAEAFVESVFGEELAEELG